MRQIKFSHNYPKLWNQQTAVLLDCGIILRPLNEDLLQYDTRTSEGGYYPLPAGELIQLIFVGNKGIPFCTLRRSTPEKLKYYKASVKQVFEIIIAEVVK